MKRTNLLFHILLSLFLAGGITGCHHTLSKSAFLHLYLDSMQHRFPGVKFTILDDHTIVGKYGEKEVRHFIDNAFTQYGADPDSLGPTLHTYVLSATAVYTDQGKLRRENVVPVIKPASYLEDLRQPAITAVTKKDFQPAYETYNDQLIILYAEDSKNGMSYFPAGQLDSLGISKDSLRPLAVKNLVRVLPEIKRYRIDSAHSLYMLVAGGNYEASIVLMNSVWTKENMPVDGDFVVGIPGRDVLLVTGANNKEEIAIMKNKVKEIYATEPYQVSESLFRRVKGKFVKFE